MTPILWNILALLIVCALDSFEIYFLKDAVIKMYISILYWIHPH